MCECEDGCSSLDEREEMKKKASPVVIREDTLLEVLRLREMIPGAEHDS